MEVGTSPLTCWTLMRLLMRSEEHTSELQSRLHLVCRLLLEKKKQNASRKIVWGQRTHAPHEVLYSGATYQTGATVLQMLRHEFGDSDVRTGIKRYMTERTRDLRVPETRANRRRQHRAARSTRIAMKSPPRRSISPLRASTRGSQVGPEQREGTRRAPLDRRPQGHDPVPCPPAGKETEFVEH